MVNEVDRANSRARRHKRVRARLSGDAVRPRLCIFRSLDHIYVQAIAAILKDEGYIAEVAAVEKGGFKRLRITLRYDAEGNSYLSGISRVSKQGKRVYCGHDEMPQVLGGLGVTIVSTPKGMMSGRKAKKSRIGGEVVCSVW